MTLGLIIAGCGAEPRDVATSERQIRQTVIDFNVLTASGKGEQACALLTPERREGWMDISFHRALRDAVPQVNDCASWVDYMGPRMDERARNMMFNAQVSAVSVDGDRATATWATGGTVHLRWSDGRWLIGGDK